MNLCSWCGKEIAGPHHYQLISRPEVRLHSNCLDLIWRVAKAAQDLWWAVEAGAVEAGKALVIDAEPSEKG
jgi:hypothetical protein